MQGDTHVGTLLLDHIDQPWLHCRFTATAAWDSVRPVLAAWTQAVESDDSNELAVDEALEAVDALQLALVAVAGSERIDDFLIHVEGDTARFRY
ncbi:hypothetical protein GCM10010421_28130 [Streptomyces glaucus]|uniref:Uncharacterized protein n=2 Tax=Streptomyces glaucus TaxID=284029 RepID=A0ABP5WXW5_9ACTN